MKKRRHFSMRILGIVILAILVWSGIIAIILYGLFKPEQEKITKVRKYQYVLGADGKYKDNLLGYNNIFPDKIPDKAQVEEFYYQYYNPWDPNYLGYLVYTCDAETYEKEYQRLQGLESTSDNQVYGVKSFPYQLCAVTANDYGLRYALADGENHRLIYVEIAFCNYFTDIDYQKVIQQKYLPIGFDASSDNPVSEAFRKRIEEKERIR
ncbi:MAG: hypothetical protein PHE02_14120 [Lachnospiraceae bacterium]|nr:hypothetical protein [Lachnospiraceae bacterium]